MSPDHEPNPYASPQVADLPRLWTHAEIQFKLQRLTFGLLGFSGTHIFAAVLILSVELLRIAPWEGDDLSAHHSTIRWLALMACTLPIQCLIFGAAWQMRRQRNLGFCRTMAIVSSIPGLSPLGYLGIPFGILTTILLFRTDVAADFDLQLKLKSEGASVLSS
jgi:hypothetical protein